MNYVMPKVQAALGVSSKELMALGRVHPEQDSEPFCMTVLALKLSRAANGVSELHGQVSREMWEELYPGTTAEKVPIGHITNGIHIPGWIKGTQRRWLKRPRKRKAIGCAITMKTPLRPSRKPSWRVPSPCARMSSGSATITCTVM